MGYSVTISSGYMLSRFKGPVASAWFGTIYVFRTVPYISWVLPLYFVTQWLGVFDSYAGLLLPHIASGSVATRMAMAKLVVDNVTAWFAGKPPLTPIPETPYKGY